MASTATALCKEIRAVPKRRNNEPPPTPQQSSRQIAKPRPVPLSTAFLYDRLHHKAIWQASGKCVKCSRKDREMMCSRCGEPMCIPCLRSHEQVDHARDRHIERIARGEVQHGIPPDEWSEAMALRAKWDEDAKAEDPDNTE